MRVSFGCSKYGVLSLDNRNNRGNKMECFPCNPKVFFPPHVQSIWIEQVFKPVLRSWKNPHDTPKPTFLQIKASKYTEKRRLSSSLGPLSYQSLKKNHSWSPCSLQHRKKVMKGGETFLFDLRDYLTCFRFAREIFVYATWNLIPSISSKYPDVVFLSVTFSPGENELPRVFPR